MQTDREIVTRHDEAERENERKKAIEVRVETSSEGGCVCDSVPEMKVLLVGCCDKKVSCAKRLSPCSAPCFLFCFLEQMRVFIAVIVFDKEWGRKRMMPVSRSVSV